MLELRRSQVMFARESARVSVHDADRRELNERGFAAPGSFDTRVRIAGRYYLKNKLHYCCVRVPQPYTITLSS
jgi:hypothetical protein